MFSLSPLKILLIAAVIMVLLGPDKLPEVANKLGAGWRSLKRLQQRVESEVREAVPNLPTSAELARVVRSPVNLLNTLAERTNESLTVDLSETPGSGEVPISLSPEAQREIAAASSPVPPSPTAPTPTPQPRIVTQNDTNDPSLN